MSMHTKMRSAGWVMTFLMSTSLALANDCPGNSNALGTARTLTVRPSEYPLVGKVQYPETLRLKNREVILTFDDGPAAPYTSTILDILASECIKATFFVLGSNLTEAPDLVRRAFNHGHSIGTHTFDHKNLASVSFDEAREQIDKGIATAREVLGEMIVEPARYARCVVSPVVDEDAAHDRAKRSSIR